MFKKIAATLIFLAIVTASAFAAKTVFIDGTPSLGIKGTKVTAAYLNAINKHFQTGLDTDGDGSLPYSAVTGTNALISTITPTAYFPASYVAGMPIYLKSAATNTGAMTLNINSIGTGTIKKNGSTDLAAGDVQAGQMMAVAFDGTNFQMLSPPGIIGYITAVTNTTPASVNIKIKILDIGDWNMDTTADKVVAHGLTASKIRNVEASIRNDEGTALLGVPFVYVPAASLPAAFITTVDATNVNIYRTTSGQFDSTEYDATSYNRGWIVITYVE